MLPFCLLIFTVFSGTSSLAPPHAQPLPTEDRSAKGSWPERARFRDRDANRDADEVVIQGHGTVQRQQSAIHRCASIRRDGCQSQNVSHEVRVSSDRRRTADLPKNLARLSATGQDNTATGVTGSTGCRGERAPNLEIVEPIAAESECSRQLSRRAEEIDAWREYECPQILTGQDVKDRLACQSIVCSEGISLCLLRDRVIVVYRSIHDPRRIKASDRSTWIEPHISVDNGIAGARHRRSPQDPEAGSRT